MTRWLVFDVGEARTFIPLACRLPTSSGGRGAWCRRAGRRRRACAISARSPGVPALPA